MRHDDAPGQERKQHREIDREQALRRTALAHAHHVSEPGSGPERLNGDQTAVDDEGQRRQAHEVRVAKDVDVTQARVTLDPGCIASAGVSHIGGDGDGNGDPCAREQAGHSPKQAAPADQRNHRLDR